jgi:uncharacterized protein (DUF736 family)
MAEYTHKLNHGSIFKNDFKKEDKHPDFRGQVNVEGVLKDIALWFAKDKEGKTYFSVTVSEPRQKPEQSSVTQSEQDDFLGNTKQEAAHEAQVSNNEDSGDLPF